MWATWATMLSDPSADKIVAVSIYRDQSHWRSGRGTTGKMRFDTPRRAIEGVSSVVPTAAFHQNVAVSPDCLIGTPEISGLFAAGRMNHDTSPA
jgi:hypothetical protein